MCKSVTAVSADFEQHLIVAACRTRRQRHDEQPRPLEHADQVAAADDADHEQGQHEAPDQAADLLQSV